MADEVKTVVDAADATAAADKAASETKTADTIVKTADGGTVDKAADKGAADNTDKTADEVVEKVAEKGAPDWRTRLAGDDKALLKTLARYPDEAAFGKAHRALQTKLSSGEFKKALPEGASEEEKATWRKENGLPEKPEGYVEGLELPNGVVLGEADKPIVAEFAASAFESGVDKKAFSGLVAKYYAIQDAQRAQREEADAAFKLESEEALRGEWQGPEYRRNLTAVNNMMKGWPEGLADRVLAGRSPDGKMLGNDPMFIKQLASLALELNPHATLVPAGTTDAAKTANARLEEIRAFRRDNPDGYNADKKMQAEEVELIDANLKIQARGKAA
jgi:hypothetical protein